MAENTSALHTGLSLMRTTLSDLLLGTGLLETIGLRSRRWLVLRSGVGTSEAAGLTALLFGGGISWEGVWWLNMMVQGFRVICKPKCGEPTASYFTCEAVLNDKPWVALREVAMKN